MYETRPNRTNAKAKITVFCCFFAAMASFAAASLVPKFPAALQCVGLCLLLPVIQLTARYLILQHLYRLTAREDGGVDFEVFTYRGGARMQLVCRVGLDEITAVAELSDANRRAPHGLRRYNYHPDLAPAKGLVVSLSNGDGVCELLLAHDARLLETFRAASERK